MNHPLRDDLHTDGANFARAHKRISEYQHERYTDLKDYGKREESLTESMMTGLAFVIAVAIMVLLVAILLETA